MRRRVELNEETDSFNKITGDIKQRKRIQKKQKRKRFYKRVMKIAFIIFVFFLLYKFDSWSGSRLETIVIKGNSLLTQEEILETSRLEKGNRIFLSFNKLIEKRLEKNPLLEKADVEIIYSKQTIMVNVLEEKAVAYEVQPEMNIYFKNGEKISLDTENIHGIEGLVLLSNILDEDFKKSIVLKIADLDESSALAISEILHKGEKLDDEALLLVMNHGYYVFSNLETLPLLDNYATIISGANPENKCIHLLEYGPTEDTQVATAKPCQFEQIENNEEE